MKSYLTNSKIFGLGPLWRPQGQKRPKKQVWLKMLRIVQFGEKSNKIFLPVIIFKANWRPTTLKTFGKMVFFLGKSIFYHKIKIISNYICYIFPWNEKTLLYSRVSLWWDISKELFHNYILLHMTGMAAKSTQFQNLRIRYERKMIKSFSLIFTIKRN